MIKSHVSLLNLSEFLQRKYCNFVIATARCLGIRFVVNSIHMYIVSVKHFTTFGSKYLYILNDKWSLDTFKGVDHTILRNYVQHIIKNNLKNRLYNII